MTPPGITLSITGYDNPGERIIPGIVAVRKVASIVTRDGLGLREAKELVEHVRDGFQSIDRFRFSSVEGARLAAALLRDHGFTCAVHQVVTNRVLLDPREAD